MSAKDMRLSTPADSYALPDMIERRFGVPVNPDHDPAAHTYCGNPACLRPTLQRLTVPVYGPDRQQYAVCRSCADRLQADWCDGAAVQWRGCLHCAALLSPGYQEESGRVCRGCKARHAGRPGMAAVAVRAGAGPRAGGDWEGESNA